MHVFVVGPERERLKFAESVVRAFGFLVEDLGFRVVTSSSTFVRYEREDMFLNVFQGRGSYELGVEIGHLIEHKGETVEEKFHIADVIELDHDLDDSGYRPYSTNDREAVARFVNHLAELVRLYAMPLLRGDPDLFLRLRNERIRRGDIERQGLKARRLRERAEKAFRKGDFSSVELAYSEILRDLPTIQLKASELKRLEIARRRLRETHE